MKTYWWNGGTAPTILTPALDGCEWLASRFGYFTPRERSPHHRTRCMGGWVGPRGGLDAVEKRKALPLLGIEPWLSLYQIPGS
jgi:hypothetical protein